MAKSKAVTESMPDKEEEKEENEWMAKRDLETLIEAEKIKLDEARLKAAMAKKREMAKALGEVGK